jgi:hypothetical protein
LSLSFEGPGNIDRVVGEGEGEGENQRRIPHVCSGPRPRR